jgi:hypothetical protein
MARPKLWSFSMTSGETTTVYWPTDTWVSTQEYAIVFRHPGGTGGFMSGCSAAWSIDRVLATGVASAHFVQITAFSTNSQIVHEDPASCFRFVLRASGAATLEIMAMQSGPERAF